METANIYSKTSLNLSSPPTYISRKFHIRKSLFGITVQALLSWTVIHYPHLNSYPLSTLNSQERCLNVDCNTESKFLKQINGEVLSHLPHSLAEYLAGFSSRYKKYHWYFNRYGHLSKSTGKQNMIFSKKMSWSRIIYSHHFAISLT